MSKQIQSKMNLSVLNVGDTAILNILGHSLEGIYLSKGFYYLNKPEGYRLNGVRLTCSSGFSIHGDVPKEVEDNINKLGLNPYEYRLWPHCNRTFIVGFIRAKTVQPSKKYIDQCPCGIHPSACIYHR